MANREKGNSIDFANYPDIFNDPSSSGVFGKLEYMPDEGWGSRAVTNLQNKRLLESLDPYTNNHLSNQETIPSDPKIRKNLFPIIVDMECVDPEISRKERFISDLRLAFENHSVEDGVVHPAEKIIDEALCSMNRQGVYQWLSELSLDVAHSDMAASALRCLGRRDSEPTAWCVRLVKSALKIDDVEIRDAAVQAAESWGKVEFCNVLEKHSEDVHWLNDYIQDVVCNLKESK
ncbi:MAG: hypothetical protein OXF73_08215 [Gammaproteobacteria bacterium]|nr:hypothetical protein [Gammaproteobacteria bacterium]